MTASLVGTGTWSFSDPDGTVEDFLASFPTTVDAGELLLSLVGRNNHGNEVAAPTGFTELAPLSTTNKACWAFRKVAVGNEDGTTYQLGVSESGFFRNWAVGTFRIQNHNGVNASSSLLVEYQQNPAIPSLTTTVADCLVIHILFSRQDLVTNAPTPPSGASLLTVQKWQNTGNTSWVSMAIATSVKTTAGAISAGAWATTADDYCAAAVIAIAPLDTGLQGTAQSTAASAAQLSTAIRAAATAGNVASSSAAITTAVRLAMAAVVNAAAGGALTTAKPIAAAAADVASATANLAAGAVLQAAATDVALAVAAMSTAIRLGAVAADSAGASAVLINWASVTLAGTLYTGTGGALDPNFWVDDVPGLGDTIYYDPTFITIYPNAEISATTNSCVAQTMFMGPNGQALGLVVITPQMVAYANDSAAASGALSTAIRLAAAASAVAAASAALGTGAGLRADAAVVAGASADLTLPKALQALASDVTTSTAVLLTAIRMTAAAADNAGATAALNSMSVLNAAASVSSAVSAALQTQITPAANAADVASSAGSLSTGIQAAGTAGDVATAAALLTTVIRANANAAGQASGSGQLTVYKELLATAVDVAIAAAVLSTDIDMSANAEGLSSAIAQMSGEINLMATAAAQTTATAWISDVIETPPIGIYPSDPAYTVSRPYESYFGSSRTPRFDSKLAAQAVVLTFDLEPALQGATLQGAITRTITAVAGIDADATSLFVEVPAYDMTKRKILQPVSGGVPGTYYYLSMTAMASNGRPVTLTGLLQVRA